MRRVLVSHDGWQRFVNRAKKHQAKSREYIEALWGNITDDAFHIIKFSPMRGVFEQKEEDLQFEDLEGPRNRFFARRRGLTYLGTIHTHPEHCDSSGSVEDHKSGVSQKDPLMGILRLFKVKNRWFQEINWWIPQAPLAFEFTDELQLPVSQTKADPPVAVPEASA